MIVTLFIIATATFFLLAAIPGNSLTERAERLPEQIRQNLFKKYGLDKSLLERYVITMKGLVVGDFGESIMFPGETVQSIIEDKLPASARLGVQQIVVGVVLGLFLGIISAMKRGTWIDYGIMILTILIISIPHLIFGLLLQKVFAGNLGWFPVIGWPKSGDSWLSGLKYTILPTITGSFTYIAFYARLLRTSMLDVLNQEYIVTAESKGLSKWNIIKNHVLRNSFIPIITYLPMSIAMCITGSFFIEKIYSIPGLGLYYVNSVAGRDVSVVMGQTVIIAAMYILIIYITDILYTFVDPRIRIHGGKR
jgi:oligopeptide transport system permease protein